MRIWYNFDTSITKYTSMDQSAMRKKAARILPSPRNPKEEVQALQDTLYVIGGKWKLPIINALCNGHTRFRDIERNIPGITTRMLSRELKEMEANELVKRTVKDTSPPAVEYTTTEYCYSFADIILDMIKWGREHRRKIKTTLRNKQG